MKKRIPLLLCAACILSILANIQAGVTRIRALTDTTDFSALQFNGLVGLVLDQATGTPLTGISVRITTTLDENQYTAETLTDSKGMYILELPDAASRTLTATVTHNGVSMGTPVTIDFPIGGLMLDWSISKVPTQQTSELGQGLATLSTQDRKEGSPSSPQQVSSAILPYESVVHSTDNKSALSKETVAMVLEKLNSSPLGYGARGVVFQSRYAVNLSQVADQKLAAIAAQLKDPSRAKALTADFPDPAADELITGGKHPIERISYDARWAGSNDALLVRIVKMPDGSPPMSQANAVETLLSRGPIRPSIMPLSFEVNPIGEHSVYAVWTDMTMLVHETGGYITQIMVRSADPRKLTKERLVGVFRQLAR